MKNYYESQLESLVDVPDSFKSIKIFSGDGTNSKQLDLNSESIPILILWLQDELRKLK